jgi:hypothetical protein
MKREARAAMVVAMAAAACSPRVDEYQERGDQYAAQGEYVDARVEYDLALEEAGGDAPTGLVMKAGDLALRSKSFNEANALFDVLIEDDPGTRDEVMALYHLYANRWVATGDTFAALQAIEWLRASDSSFNLGPLYFTVGDAAHARPDFDGAIEAYVLGLARAGDQVPPEVYARLGDAFERKRNCPAAIEHFQSYLGAAGEEKPLAPEARYRLGACALRMAERAFAADDWARAMQYVELVTRTGEPVSRLDEAALLQARVYERLDNRDAAMAQYAGIVDRNEGTQSRPVLQAYRRLKQLEFGLPLETAERVAAEREREARRASPGGTR